MHILKHREVKPENCSCCPLCLTVFQVSVRFSPEDFLPKGKRVARESQASRCPSCERTNSPLDASADMVLAWL